MLTNWDKFWIGLLATLLGVLFYAMWYLLDKEQREWDAFSGQHECKVVGKKKSQVYNTVTIDSKGSPQVGICTTAEQTAYQCNDGVTYWR